MNQIDVHKDAYDVFIIGGGVNGCGVARDAAGRGFRVGLAEMNDLGSATSSASTKLFHGGLRYLEYFEFRLVRESLKEREVLLRTMPHISWPMRFVLPYHRDMRFARVTPVSRLLATLMPWMRGRRPAWLIRFGLFLYDHMGGREILPGTHTIDLACNAVGKPLKSKFRKAFEYSDCWVDDSRLVVLNARDARDRGADIMTRTKVVRAERTENRWLVTLDADGKSSTVVTRMLVNAGGPWVKEIIREPIGMNETAGIRLVRGSHIVTRKLFKHDQSYFFQGSDGRIIFAIPYENDFTLVGTTDVDHPDPSVKPTCTDSESDYLLEFASEYFDRPLSRSDIVWRYSGVRPLYDDGATSALAATRDYVLKVNSVGGAPLLNVYGGKITTYRKLSEAVMAHISTELAVKTESWTERVPLPGGDFPVDGFHEQVEILKRGFPFLNEGWAKRLIRAYGTDAARLLGGARSIKDLGEHFGATITAAEIEWGIENEWVRSAEDFLWRRSKAGLRLSDAQAGQIEAFIFQRLAASEPRAATAT